MSFSSDDPTSTQPGWRNAIWLPAALLIFMQITSGMREMPQMAFFLIYLQEQLGLVPVAISSVVAAAQIVGMATALLGGAIAARLGSKWVMVCGLCLSCLGSLAFQIHILWLVVILWLFSGAGLALTTVGGSSYLTRISKRGSIGILAAIYVLSTTIGGSFGNPLAGALIENSGFHAFSWMVIGITAFTILVLAVFLPAYKESIANPLLLRSFWRGIVATSRQTNVRMLTGMRSLPTVFYGMLTVLIPLLINDLTGSKVTVAVYGTTNLIVASAAQLLAGRAADRWGARKPTLAAYTILILAGLGLAVSARTLPGLFGFGVLGIASAWALATLMFIWVNDGVPKSEHPSTFGLLHAVWNLSMISGTILGGGFVATRPGLPFFIGGLLNIGSLFMTHAYYNRQSVKNGANH